MSIGLSPNKFLAKLASELQKPRGFSVIGTAEAKAFLAPLPVSKINGVGAATAARMDAEGIRTIGDLQAMSDQQLAALFGKFGHRLYHYAHGEDDRVVTPWRPTKSVSSENTFRRDTGRVRGSRSGGEGPRRRCRSPSCSARGWLPAPWC